MGLSWILGVPTKGLSEASSLIVHFESLQREITILPFSTGVINTHIPTSEKRDNLALRHNFPYFLHSLSLLFLPFIETLH